MEHVEVHVETTWPAWSAQLFHRLNAFMERCNDLHEVTSTVIHFKYVCMYYRIYNCCTYSSSCAYVCTHTYVHFMFLLACVYVFMVTHPF